jgi:alkylation response protein AidB-like acyl-CoA dehydrogenase
MAQSADVINIFAHPEESADPETALSFLISPKLDGIRVERNWNKLGMRATRSDNLVLENVFASDSRRSSEQKIDWDASPVRS